MASTADTTVDSWRPAEGHDIGPLLDHLRHKRDTAPVGLDARTGMLTAYRYADVHQVLNDHRTFSSQVYRVSASAAESRGNLGMTDPPVHRGMRSLVSQAFTRRMVAEFEPRIADLARRALDGAAGRESFDLIGELARPLPVTVIGELLGVPSSDHELFRGWADDMLTIDADDPTDPQYLATMKASKQAMRAYLLERCEERRARPTDDLIGRLVVAEVDGSRLSDEELVDFSSLLLMAGHFTTTALLGNAALCLADNPDAATAVRDDPELLPGAIEESFRYRTSAAQLARITNEATVLGGVEIPAETVVGISLMSANHDERQFTDPGRFDIARDPNPHLALGHGVHFCLGASLARMELRIVIGELLDRFGGVRIAPGAELEFYAAPGLHALKALPLDIRTV